MPNPICDKSLEAFAGLLKVVKELEIVEARRDYLKMLIKKAQEELKKEYGEGYITKKKVKNYRYPVFRSLERGKDYNLERNYPELAQRVTEYYELMKRVKELNAMRKKLNDFIDKAYVMCVPPDVRNPKKAYKVRLKNVSLLAEIEEGLREQCDEGDEESCKNLKEFEECGEFYVDAKKKVVRCAE